jgi:phospholipase A1
LEKLHAHSQKTTLFLTLGIAPALALARPDLELRLERCAVLGDASARLACYDGLTKTARQCRRGERGPGNAPPPPSRKPSARRQLAR